MSLALDDSFILSAFSVSEFLAMLNTLRVFSWALGFSKMWKREAPFDVLVLREAESLDELKSGAVIGTGSEARSERGVS